MIDFTAFSNNLVEKEDGIWYGKTQNEISYPEEEIAFVFNWKMIVIGFNIEIIVLLIW
jgi:hypothetical protein